MTTIDGNNKIYTLINVFTVEPEKNEALFEHLKEATSTVFNDIPGYISANIHISDDKKTITNYAQWASKEAYLNIFKNETVVKHLEMAASLAISYAPVLYNEIWSHNNHKK